MEEQRWSKPRLEKALQHYPWRESLGASISFMNAFNPLFIFNNIHMGNRQPLFLPCSCRICAAMRVPFLQTHV